MSFLGLLSFNLSVVLYLSRGVGFRPTANSGHVVFDAPAPTLGLLAGEWAILCLGSTKFVHLDAVKF